MAAPRRYVFAGGGTGGHVIPNLAMIREIREREPEAEIVYLGTRRGAESRLLGDDDLRFVTIFARPSAHPRRIVPFLCFAFCLVLGTMRSLWVLARFRPHVMVATGGYVSVPPGLAAALLRVPIFLHEQNVKPGKANLFLARFAARIGVSFEETLRWFPSSKAELTGYPVRKRFDGSDAAVARRKLSIPENHRVAFIVGGSMGARSINRATVDSLGHLLADERITIIHSTGLKDRGEYHAWDDTVERLKAAKLPEELRDRYIMSNYFESIEEAYAASDLVVARPGAGTMMELAALGKPSLLIPKSDAPDNHQLMNALSLKEQGSAEVLFEELYEEGEGAVSRVHGDQLARKIHDMLEDPERLERMSDSARALMVPDATRNNVEVIIDLASRGGAARTRSVQHLVGSLTSSDGTVTDMMFPVTTIGRQSTADVRVDAPRGDRALIRRIGDGRDEVQFQLVARNGTVTVDGERVEKRCILHPGDMIGVGAEHLTFNARIATVSVPAAKGSVLARIITAGFGTLASRVFGLVRLIVLATVFGPGRIMDIFAAGLTASNLFRRVFAENAVDSAFLPTFVMLYRSGRKEEALRLFGTVLTALVVITGALTALGMVTVSLWLPWLVPGWESKGMIDDAVRLTRILLPYLVLITVAAVLGAVLKAFNRFGAPSYSSIMFSVGVVAGVALYPVFGLTALGIGVLLGGIGQIALHLPAFFSREFRRRYEVRYKPQLALDDAGMRKVRAAAPKIFADVAITKAGSVVDLMIVSTLAIGHYSVLYIALLLFQLPFALISQSINTVVLKEFSESQAIRDAQWCRRLVTSGITWNIFLLVPIAALMITLSRPIVDLLLVYGNFGVTDGGMVAVALSCYSIGLVGWGLQGLMGRFYAARLEIGQAMAVNAACVVLNIALSLTFVAMGMSYAGVALGTSFAFLANGAFRMWHLNRNMRRDGGGFDWSEVLPSARKTVAATAVASFVTWQTHMAIAGFDGLPLPLSRLLVLASPAIMGLLAFCVIARALRSPEMDDALARIRRLGPVQPSSDAPRSSANIYCLNPQQLLRTAHKHPEAVATVNLTRRIQDFLKKSHWKTRNIGVKLIGELKVIPLRYELCEIIEDRRRASFVHRVLGGDYRCPGFMRRNAVKSLARLDACDDVIERALLTALDDPYWEVRSAAAAALARLAARLTPAAREYAYARLAEMVKLRNFEVAHRAVTALQSVATDAGVLTVLGELHYHRNWQVRSAVVRAYYELYKRGVVEDREDLVRRLEDVLVTSDMFVPSFELKDNIRKVRAGLTAHADDEPAPPASQEKEANA